MSLQTTTLAQAITSRDTFVVLASSNNVYVGVVLAVEAELLRVTQLGPATSVIVQRGTDGTAAVAHAAAAVVTIGIPDDFATQPVSSFVSGLPGARTGLVTIQDTTNETNTETIEVNGGGGGGSPGGSTTQLQYNNAGSFGGISGATTDGATVTLVTPSLGTPLQLTLTNATGLPVGGITGLGTGVATFLGTPSSANLAAAVTGETGSGALVFATSPALVTPDLGTPTALVLTNATGLPSSAITGLGTGVATFLATPSSANLAAAVTDETGSGALVFATSPVLVTPNLGVPSAIDLTHAIGMPLTGITGFGTNVATFLATPSSANLAAAVTDETGSGALVFATSPTFVTPILGVAAATSINRIALTAPATSATLTILDSKTFTVNKTLTLDGTDSTTMTFPSTSATIARIDAAQTFTGNQTIAALIGPVTITEAVGSSGLTVSGATQVSSFPALSVTQTWNASGTTFTGLKINVTSTASAAGSLLMDLQVGGATLASINKSGHIGGKRIYVNGLGDDAYWDSPGGEQATWNSSGANTLFIGNATVATRSSQSFGWASGGDAEGTVDLSLSRDAANTLALRNATNAQKFKIYNTFTTIDTAGEWFAIDWITTANVVNLQAVKGSSTGTARVLKISYGGAEASPVAAISVPITSGNITFGGGITLPGGATFLTTNTALTDGAGVGAGTLATAPAAGNPTKWIGINDNGTTRYIPAW